MYVCVAIAAEPNLMFERASDNAVSPRLAVLDGVDDWRVDVVK